MGLTLTDLVLLAAPLVILYAIVHTLENVEKECGDSHLSDEPHQTNKLEEGESLLSALAREYKRRRLHSSHSLDNNFYPRKLRLRGKRKGGINV